MKKNLFSVCAIFCATQLYAQEPTYQWGTMHTNQNSADMTQVISRDETGFYLLRKGGPITQEICLLEKYDNQNNFIFSENLITENPGILGNSLLYKNTIAGDHLFYNFYDGWIKDKGKAFCYVTTTNTEGKIYGQGVELVQNSAEKQLNSGNYIPVLSPDKNLLLILTNMPKQKEGNEKIKIDVFEAKTFTPLWNKEITLEIESKAGPDNFPIIDNEGNVFIRKKFNGPKQSVDYFIYSCTGKDHIWKVNKIDIGSNVIIDHKFLFNIKQQPVFTGFYGVSENKNQGTFYFSISTTTGEIKTHKLEPHGTSLLSNFLSESQAEKPDAAIDQFVIKDVLQKSNGDILLIAEFRNERSTAVVGGSTLSPTYEYDILTKDILILNINDSGTKTWFTILDKSQSEITRNKQMAYGSFCYALVKDNLYILWNNIDLTPSSIPPQHWKEPDGTMFVKNKVFDYKTTRHAAFLYIVNENGAQTFADRTFGLPLFNLHTGSPYELSMNPNIFVATENGIIILANMHDDAKRYRFGNLILH